MKKLPIGIQTFREIIEDGYLYADKTRYIYDLASEGKFFFLSRPRRFGKSLLVDTMKEAFLGNRALFDGLYLGESDFAFTPHPVIRLDLSMVENRDQESLRQGLVANLATIAADAGLTVDAIDPAEYLRQLILGLAKASGRRVVVLIDEYDKPMIDHLHEPSIAEGNRVELRYLYGILKGMDAHLRFVFLTGVSKFTRTSIFSQLNNVTDISLDPLFANICGFVNDEFDDLFGERLAELRLPGVPDDYAARRRAVFDWYDGYSWDGETHVFNPFSLLSFFRRQRLYPFWYTTGAPQFLMMRLKKEPSGYAEVQGTQITEVLLDSHDIELASLVSLLFQTGFLTVKSMDEEALPATYTLGFPNEEVSTSFSRQFLDTITAEDTPAANSWYAKMRTALDDGRPEYLQEALSGLFASIPHQIHLPAEAFYHAIFLAVMQFLGLRVIGEGSVAGGRIDGVIDRRSGRSYVLELKYEKAAEGVDVKALLDQAVQDALAQIEDRRYAETYRGTDREVYKVGIAVAGRGQVCVRALHAERR